MYNTITPDSTYNHTTGAGMSRNPVLVTDRLRHPLDLKTSGDLLLLIFLANGDCAASVHAVCLGETGGDAYLFTLSSCAVCMGEAGGDAYLSTLSSCTTRAKLDAPVSLRGALRMLLGLTNRSPRPRFWLVLSHSISSSLWKTRLRGLVRGPNCACDPYTNHLEFPSSVL